MIAALLKNAVFLVLLPGSITVLGPWLVLTSNGLAPHLAHPALLAPGAALVAVGLGVLLWCVWDFASVGRGTLAPIDPPKVLVIRGLYRHVRNPMYCGVTTALLGESLMFASSSLLVYTLIVFAGFNLFVLGYEEPTLRAKFGAAYGDHCRTVPRWIPRIPRGGS